MDDFTGLLSMASANPWLSLVVLVLTLAVTTMKYFMARAKKKAEDEAKLLADTKKVQQIIADTTVRLGDNMKTDNDLLIAATKKNLDQLKKWADGVK